MQVNSIGVNVSFGNRRKAAEQIKKIVKKTVGKDAEVSIQRHAISIWRLGKDGKIIVNGSSDPLTLAQDFAKVQRARKAGILKPQHVTKFGL